MRRTVVIGLVLVAAGALGVWWWYSTRQRKPRDLILYGNVDLRQAELAFNNSERLVEVLAEEGNRVRKGQLLARQDSSRLAPQVARAEAQVAAQREVLERHVRGSRPEEIDQARANLAAQQAVVDRLRHGSRPEEIAQARANVDSAKAELENARLRFERLKKLSAVQLGGRSEVRAVSQEDYDAARAALDVAEAKVTVNAKALELAIAGPREEEIAENEAKLVLYKKALELAIAGPRQEDTREAKALLHANEGQLTWLKRQLADTELFAPADAVVRSRLLEPGEMATPQTPVFSLAITDPKWIRAYVAEPDLGKISPGMRASVGVDSFPDRRFEGWIGFISPVAEFTPKAVQTEELRTSLVYEVRVFVKDPTDTLRLGMPASVYLVTSPPETRKPGR